MLLESLYIFTGFLNLKEKIMIIGQRKIKDSLNTVFDVFVQSDTQIRPHFFLTGETGSGKSHIIKTLAKIKGLNFLKINGAALTKEGTSGNSVAKALSPLQNLANKPVIVFVDEFDKLFVSGNSNSDLAHDTTNGVQNEFLTLLEDTKASVFGDYGKYVRVNVDKCLFCFAGAFNGAAITQEELLSMGVKTEFLGRVSLLYHTEKLSLDDLYEILDKSSLLDSYLKLFSKNKKDVIKHLKPILKKSYDENLIGARIINSIIHRYFIEGSVPVKNSFAIL